MEGQTHLETGGDLNDPMFVQGVCPLRYDYLIVGAGLAGAVLAERLTSDKKKVLVIDRRDHTGGNCHDHYDRTGVLVHTYGPHYFRTNDMVVKEYLDRFTEWKPCSPRIRAWVNNEYLPFPINRDTLNRFFRIDLRTDEEAEGLLRMKREDIPHPVNAEEMLLSRIGRELTDAFYSNYTKKHWGVPLRELDPSVAARIPVRADLDDRYFNEEFQALPREGYRKLFQNLLKNIEVRLETEYTEIMDQVDNDHIIFTGPIDEFFGYKFGKLPYRSLRFEFEHHEREFYQEWVQVNYPNDHEYTRIVEIKHLTGQELPRTIIVKEYPSETGDRFYPVPNPGNRQLYEKYKHEADELDNVTFTGRLGRYEYMNMDQVVRGSLDLFAELRSK
ncbi:MAG: UDP-galactopyranose mutase [Thermoplasmatota archaeon]